MFTPVTKLNRSCSESDVNKVNFDNLCLEDQHNGSDKDDYFVTRKILFVEEVLRCESPDIFRRAISYQTLGRSTPEHLNNPETFANMVNNQFFNNSVINRLGQCDPTTRRKKKYNFINQVQDDIVPMEIDVVHDSLESQDCVDFVETMDVDAHSENNANSRYHSLTNVIKNRNRNLTKPPESTNILNTCVSEADSRKNRTKVAPIAQFKNKNSNNTCILLAVIILLPFLVYLAFFYDNLYVNSDVQCYHIEKDLIEKVHGQNASVQIIVRTLQQREAWHNKIKILSFVGSTGVGKTFAANLIKKHFFPELAHELFGMHLNYESQTIKILNAIRSCCLNLIVIDDLKRRDITELLAFIHTLPEDNFILVVSIFNIQYTNDKINHHINYTDIIEIRNEFDNSGLHHELIVFEELNDVQVKDWMKKQMISQNIAKKLREQILENVLNGHDVKYNGLKGLYSKLLLELEKQAH